MTSIVPTDQDYAAAREHLIDILAAVNGRLHGPRGREAVASVYAREIDALCNSAWQPAELAALQNRMSDLLTRTANALKGDPAQIGEHGGEWSWHDLPEVAAALAGKADQ